MERLQCQHFRIVQRYPMSGNVYNCFHFCGFQCGLLLLLFWGVFVFLMCVGWGGKTPTLQEVYIQLSLFNRKLRHPMSAKSTLLAPLQLKFHESLSLHCSHTYILQTKISNVWKVYIAITFVLCKDIEILIAM